MKERNEYGFLILQEPPPYFCIAIKYKLNLFFHTIGRISGCLATKTSAGLYSDCICAVSTKGKGKVRRVAPLFYLTEDGNIESRVAESATS